ncbi:hypothetical protein F0P96_09755 [Hymenobacter busanensis]|uniref:Uncharacterized protein n=1 Tax=Hymenobacter busanensis TaxID=2607656 RepID=A0A7L5A2Q4_9BACT|nr:hypothetical protein [Hymenobacter busanensis]KAA9333253.1 hypothetical protein F0P96_09755 [Hymenobacter busanensis]QHJ08070.1 hypothetical protein GUY19_12565 [Hymenobacter busanensis]
MGKKNKKHSKKHDTLSGDLFDATALSIKKYRKVTDEIAKLSPLQKLAGGAALLTVGYFYLKNLRDDDWQHSPLAGLLPLPAWLPPRPRRPRAQPAPDAEEPAEATAPVRIPHKRAKPHKNAGSFGKKPAASPDDDQ